MFIKNNKGISLLEVLVTMGIITVLAGIAIPAYNRYKDGVKDTVLKADVSNARKAYLAHDATNNTFCATLKDVGLTGIGGSDLYQKASQGFAGFASVTGCPSTVTPAKVQKLKGSPMAAATCVLQPGEFIIAAGFAKSTSDHTGFFISDDDSGPRASKGGSCSTQASGQAACTSAQCVTSHACNANTVGVWNAGAIPDLCKDS